MWWGYQQGCEYVLWRCGVGTNDHSAPADSVARCGGPDWWEDAPQQKAYLASKCVDGIDPCSNANTDRYTTVPSLHCNAQCFYNGGASRTDCALAPAGPVGGNSAGKLWGIALEEHYLQWLFIAALVLSALIFLQCAREFCCPKGGNITMILWFSAGTALFGAAMLGFCMYCLFYDSSFVAEYVGDPTLISCTVVGWALVVTSALTVYGVKRKMGSPRALLLVFVAYFVLLLLQLALAVIAVLWVQNLDAISNDTLETLRGTSNGRHDGKFGAALLGEMEAFTCQTYTLCCWDPALDLMNVNVTDGDARCRTPHAGDNQIQTGIDDPSFSSFCFYVSGSSSNVVPAPGVCTLLDLIDGVSLPSCQSAFCPSGVDGYFYFVDALVAFLRKYNYVICGAFTLVVLCQIVLLGNLWQLRRRFVKVRARVRDSKDGKTVERHFSISLFNRNKSARTSP